MGNVDYETAVAEFFDDLKIIGEQSAIPEFMRKLRALHFDNRAIYREVERRIRK